jgi:hypothetical protein
VLYRSARVVARCIIFPRSIDYPSSHMTLAQSSWPRSSGNAGEGGHENALHPARESLGERLLRKNAHADPPRRKVSRLPFPSIGEHNLASGLSVIQLRRAMVGASISKSKNSPRNANPLRLDSVNQESH